MQTSDFGISRQCTFILLKPFLFSKKLQWFQSALDISMFAICIRQFLSGFVCVPSKVERLKIGTQGNRLMPRTQSIIFPQEMSKQASNRGVVSSYCKQACFKLKILIKWTETSGIAKCCVHCFNESSFMKLAQM